LSTPLYGLVRGRQWVARPATVSEARLAELPRHLGEVTWLPGLALSSSAADAWLTPTLEVANERRMVLAAMGRQGMVTTVRAVPRVPR
jgi:hypothetical protein